MPEQQTLEIFFTWLLLGGYHDVRWTLYRVLFTCQAMNWWNPYGVPSVTTETCDDIRGFVPRESFNERDILHYNPVSDNKAFWDWIPIQADTCKCYVAGSESSKAWNKN